MWLEHHEQRGRESGMRLGNPQGLEGHGAEGRWYFECSGEPLEGSEPERDREDQVSY